MAGIEYFYQLDEADSPLLDVNGQPEIVAPKVMRTESYVRKHLESGRLKPKALDNFCQQVADGENWAKYKAWGKKQNDHKEALNKYEGELTAYQDLEGEALEQAVEPTAPTEPAPLRFEPVTMEQVKARLSHELEVQNKAKRQSEVNNIVIEVDGLLFDGDETSQTRMDRAARTMEKQGQKTQPWKMSNNEFHDVTADQLTRAILAAGQKQTELWVKYA